MNFNPYALAQRVGRDQSGQVLPWMIVMMGIFCGIAALVIDVGRGVIAYQELVASTNAAALAAGYTLPAANYNCEALMFSSSSNSNNGTGNTNYCGSGTSSVYTGANVYPMLQNVSTTVSARCSTTLSGSAWNIPCQTITGTTSTANVVTITQSAQVPTYFAGMIGIHTITIGAKASAATRGAGAQSWNVAIVLDTTGSMSSSDSGCGSVPGVSGTPTRLQCALYGVQILVGDLDPCPSTYSSCSSTTQTSERVTLWTFPSMTSTTVVQDTNCGSTNPTIEPYTFPTATPTKTSYSDGTYISGGTTYSMTYAITTNSAGTSPSYLTDYRSSDTASTLSTSSAVSKAIGAGGSSCSPVSNPGGQSTYYAGALYAAQASLLAEQATLKTAGQASQNAIILLSDGDAEAGQSNMVSSSSQTCTGCLVATSNGSYPSWNDECGQAITAAQTIAGQGTRIYTVAYGSESSGCKTDTSGTYSGVTPCQAMEKMSSSYWATPSSDQYFYADSSQSGSGVDTSCNSNTNNTLTNLKDIFLAIGNDLQNSRLIPYSIASN